LFWFGNFSNGRKWCLAPSSWAGIHSIVLCCVVLI